MTFEEKMLAVHKKAGYVASLWYIRKGFIPPLLTEIAEATKSIKALAAYNFKTYNPDEPRVPAGSGRISGEWTSGGGENDGADDDDSDQQVAQPASQLSISEEGLAFIKQHEGFEATAYDDGAGNQTIGYGHKLKPGESYPNGITETQAQQLLVHDVGIAESVVQDNVLVDLTQQQFDALTSLVYNIGGNSFESSTLLRLLNQGDYDAAADQFPAWNKITRNGIKVPSPSLTSRRNAERNLFINGTYQ